MKVTCPNCQLKGLVDTGPLMLSAHILCVRCATSYEVVLAGGEVEMFPSSPNGHSQVAEAAAMYHEAGWMEVKQDFDEPLDLPAPVLLREPIVEPEHALEELFAASPFSQVLEQNLQELNPAFDQDVDQDPRLQEMSVEPAQAELPEEEAPACQALYSEALLSEERPSEELPSEDEELPSEELQIEALTSEAPHFEAPTSESQLFEVLPSEDEVIASSFEAETFASEPEASSSSEPEASSLELEALPAVEPETLDLLDLSQSPAGTVATTERPIDYAHAAKDSLPYQDKYSLGVRLMRVSPVWLCASGLLFISLIFLFNWATKPDAQATNLSFKLAPATAADNAAPSASVAPADRPAPVLNPAPIVNPAPVEHPAPATKAAPPVQAEQVEEAKAMPVVTMPQPESQASGSFTVQVGSYNESSQAQERVAGLKSAGFDARVAEVEIPGRGTWYRVQCGHFNTREEATRYGLRLRSERVAAETIVTESRSR